MIKQKPPATLPDLPSGVALAWGVRTPGRRGPKPAFTVAEIVETAVRLADEDGASGVSMPRLAAALGLTTSALYRYVRDKDELVELMVDAAWASPPSLRRARTWRSAASAWTVAMVDRIGQHGWLLDVPVRVPPVTPNLLQWFEAFLDAVEKSGLSPADRMNSAITLSGYARSAAGQRRGAGAAGTRKEQDATDRFIGEQLDAGASPAVAALIGSGKYKLSSGSVDATVDFGLERTLDGIAALVERKGRR